MPRNRWIGSLSDGTQAAKHASSCSNRVQVDIATPMAMNSSAGLPHLWTMMAFIMEATEANRPVPINKQITTFSRNGRCSFHRKLKGAKDRRISVEMLTTAPILDATRITAGLTQCDRGNDMSQRAGNGLHA